MSQTLQNTGPPDAPAPAAGESLQGTKPAEEEDKAQFILYLADDAYREALGGLELWVRHLLIPVYGRELSSAEPWCPRWWEHEEAVAWLYALWMAWQSLTDARAAMTDATAWHRDYLRPVMDTLRSPMGPFAGCKPGMHRAKEPPPLDPYPS
jgi:hypothetical protein